MKARIATIRLRVPVELRREPSTSRFFRFPESHPQRAVFITTSVTKSNAPHIRRLILGAINTTEAIDTIIHTIFVSVNFRIVFTVIAFKRHGYAFGCLRLHSARASSN
jgi:hypothetical protein